MRDHERAAGIIGIAGTLRQIRHPATEMLIATYADPVVGRLLRVMPLDQQRSASNDPFFLGNTNG